MRKILIYTSILFSILSHGQVEIYKYSDFDCSESFYIKSDSFVYKHSCGLSYGEIVGTVDYSNDTLILNSSIQPLFELKKTKDSSLKNGLISISIRNTESIINSWLRVEKGKDYCDLSADQDTLLSVRRNKIENSTTYLLNQSLLHKREKLFLILNRTNLRIQIDWRNNEFNKFDIEFDDFHYILDYRFFTNQRAILSQGNLILLDNNDKQEKTQYTVTRKSGIRISKRKRVKVYKKST